MSYPDFSSKYPQVPQATGATVLVAAELSVADFAIIINAGVASAVTTLGDLGTFFASGSVIPLGRDVIGSTGTNTVQAIGGHSVDLGGTLSTEGPVAFEGAFSWVGNLTGTTDVTFPSGTNTLGTMSSFTAITNAGTEIVQQGCTLTVVGLSTALAAGEILVGNAGGTAAPVAMSGDAAITDTGSVTVSKIGGEALTLQGAAVLPAGTMLPNALASAQIFVGNGSDVASGVAMSGDAEISNTGAVTVASAGGVDFGSLAFVNAAPAGTLTGTTLASNVVSSSLTSVATIADGVWNGTPLTYPYLPASADITTITFPFIGTLPSGQVYAIPLTQAGVLLANGGSGFAYTAGLNPTATQELLVKAIHNGTVTTQGTIVISTAGAVTAPTFSNVSIAAGDAVAIVNQATADATFASWSFSLQFQKN